MKDRQDSSFMAISIQIIVLQSFAKTNNPQGERKTYKINVYKLKGMSLKARKRNNFGIYIVNDDETNV